MLDEPSLVPLEFQVVVPLLGLSMEIKSSIYLAKEPSSSSLETFFTCDGHGRVKSFVRFPVSFLPLLTTLNSWPPLDSGVLVPLSIVTSFDALLSVARPTVNPFIRRISVMLWSCLRRTVSFPK